MPVKLLGRREAKMLEYRSSAAEPLEELEIIADAAALRAISEFLASAADAMDRNDPEFKHMHFLDEQEAHGSGVPEIVVSRP